MPDRAGGHQLVYTHITRTCCVGETASMGYVGTTYSSRLNYFADNQITKLFPAAKPSTCLFSIEHSYLFRVYPHVMLF